jgi:hypothetical protein
MSTTNRFLLSRLSEIRRNIFTKYEGGNLIQIEASEITKSHISIGVFCSFVVEGNLFYGKVLNKMEQDFNNLYHKSCILKVEEFSRKVIIDVFSDTAICFSKKQQKENSYGHNN